MSSAFAEQVRSDIPRRWWGWGVAASVYLLAVLHRTSLGVAGLRAESRFHITPAQLAVFVFVQLGVYAAMQVPTGLLADRYGPKRLLIVASTLMGAAQLLFAAVPSYPAALAARAVLGCGDALTFVSVLRFTAAHFPPRRYPVLVALTAMCGTVGNVAATLPLALALRYVGWGASFASAGVLSLVVAGGVLVLMPGGGRTGEHEAVPGWAETRRRIGAAWAVPGTRLGFWVHFTGMSTTTAFAVLWGGPYLQKAADFSPTGAGSVLMASVLFAALATPLLGALIGWRPIVRAPLAVAIGALTVGGCLALVLGMGDAPPQAYVATLFVVMALGAPISMGAFSVARDYNSATTLGTASGLVNVGGFSATILIVLGIGWSLDLQGGTDAHTLRWAVAVAVAVQAVGTVRTAVWVRRVRAHVLHRMDRGQPIPVPVVRRRWDLAPPAAALDQSGTLP
ncbi:MAG: hypothetical protein QOE97_3151 [Pseudonocardiales bacterium]|jgi:MFS family permease|nr:hypothetical protein [Pseudonocardiales bacterium]